MTQSVPEVQSGDKLTVCVMFVNKECIGLASINVTGEG